MASARGKGLALNHINRQLANGDAHRTVVIGDVHGCYDELVALLAKINFGISDRVVAVGDLVVKGPKNQQVLDLFISDDRFSSVLGNHDVALLRLWQGQKLEFTGAQKKAGSELQFDREKYSSYLGSLPLMIDLGSHLVIHAGLRPGVPLHEQDADDLLELRTLGKKKRTSRKGTPWYEMYAGEKVVLFGHWPAPQPRLGPCAIGLDTGCVYGHRLSAYIVETGELVSVPALLPYRKSGRRFDKSGAQGVVQPTSSQAY